MELSSLPNDVLHSIFSELDPKDLAAVALQVLAYVILKTEPVLLSRCCHEVGAVLTRCCLCGSAGD